MKPNLILTLFFIFLIFNIGGIIAVGTMINCSTDPSIILCYHFENKTNLGENGSLILDSSNYGNNGTIINGGLNWSINGSFLNDGYITFNKSYYINVSSNSNILSNFKIINYTFSVWIKTSLFTDNTASNQLAILGGQSGSGTQPTFYFSLRNSQYYFRYINDTGGVIASSNQINDTWVHLVGIKNGNNLLLYINGSLFSNTINTEPNFMNFNTTGLRVGWTVGGIAKFNGSMDELIVWNRSLSQFDIVNLYNNYFGCYNLSLGRLTAYGNLNLCKNVYYINSTVPTNDDVINMANNNSILDCNGSTIIGNLTPTSRGIYIQANNVTIKNCNIYNYSIGLRTDLSNNLYLNNLTFGYNLDYSIFLLKSNNSIINNSNFINFNSIIAIYDSSYNNSYFNNYFYSNYSKAESIILNPLSNNNNFVNNIFNNTYIGVRLYNLASNITFSNNLCINSRYCFLSLFNLTNFFVHNNTGINLSQTLIYAKDLTNCIVSNNNVNGSGLFSSFNFNNLTIINNNIFNNSYGGNNYGVFTSNGNSYNLNFSYNNISNIYGRNIGIFDNYSNFLFSHNRYINGFGNASSASYFYDISYGNFNQNFIIDNDYFFNNSVMIRSYNSTNITIMNSFFGGFIRNDDSYNNGLQLVLSNNINIINNTFDRAGCSAILINGGFNYNISNNNIIGDINYNVLNKINCAHEPFSAIVISQLWKNWLQDGKDNDPNYAPAGSSLERYNTYNVNLSNNNINGYSVLLKSQGVYNLTQDLSNYWKVSYQSPVYLVNRTDLYVSNNWNNVSTTYSLWNGYPVIISTILDQARRYSTTNDQMQFSFFKNYSYFQNNNLTSIYQTIVFNQSNALILKSDNTAIICNDNCNITLNPFQYFYVFNNSIFNQNFYNFDSALIFLKNNSVWGNKTLSLNNGYITIPFNYSENLTYVFDNYNISEGILRDNDPIWFSSSSNIEKHIASNLSDAINTSVVFNIDSCDKLSSITYVPNGSIASVIGYSCSNGVVTISQVQINPSVASNVFLLNYKLTSNLFCSNVTSGFDSFFLAVGVILSLIAIGIIIITLVGISRSVNGNEFDLDFLDNILETLQPKGVMIILLAITILVWIIIMTMASLCTI